MTGTVVPNLLNRELNLNVVLTACPVYNGKTGRKREKVFRGNRFCDGRFFFRTSPDLGKQVT